MKASFSSRPNHSSSELAVAVAILVLILTVAGMRGVNIHIHAPDAATPEPVLQHLPECKPPVVHIPPALSTLPEGSVGGVRGEVWGSN